MIALTGTPGTGKTTISNKMQESFKKIVHLNQRIQHDFDSNEELTQVSKTDLQSKYNFNDKTLVEGHLSHLLEPSYCVVLRCQPEKLRERLAKRGYQEQKIRENCMSEALDQVLQRACEECDKVFELDTTGLSVEEASKEAEDAVTQRKQSHGNVSWAEDFTKRKLDV